MDRLRSEVPGGRGLHLVGSVVAGTGLAAVSPMRGKPQPPLLAGRSRPIPPPNVGYDT